MNITDTYQTHAQDKPNQIAIQTDKEVITYLEWMRRVEIAAAAFSREPHIHKRVALFLANEALFLQIFAGASMAGWATIVCDMRFKSQEINKRLAVTKPDIIIADKKMRQKLKVSKTPIIFTDEISDWLKVGENTETLSDKTNPSFYIGFTSGSTGEPKAFMRSHKSWIESFHCNQVDLDLKKDEHVLIPGSFTNSTFLYGALSTLFSGGSIYILKKFSARGLMHNINTFPISTVFVVPTMIQSLVKEDWENKQNITFISSGAKLHPVVQKSLSGNFPNADIYEFYGASELSYITIHKNKDDEKHANSIGKAVHNADIMICDENGQEVGRNVEGTLYVKSPMIFDKYLNNERETKKVKHGEWATVHDIAKKDDDGYIYIIGRKNEAITYGGITIYPQEIENILKGAKGVDQAVVFGVESDYWGEKIAACIKGSATKKYLQTYCMDHLTNYKIPRVWINLETLPYTRTGKVSRKVLKEWVRNGKV